MVQDGTQEFFVSLPGVDDIFFPTQESQQAFSNTVADIADSFGGPAFDEIIQFFQGGFVHLMHVTMHGLHFFLV